MEFEGESVVGISLEGYTNKEEERQDTENKIKFYVRIAIDWVQITVIVSLSLILMLLALGLIAVIYTRVVHLIGVHCWLEEEEIRNIDRILTYGAGGALINIGIKTLPKKFKKLQRSSKKTINDTQQERYPST